MLIDIAFRLFEKDGYEKVSVSTIITAADPSVYEIARVAVAQIAFGVVLTSMITPILTEKYLRKRKLQKRSLNM
ncbi:2-keto-3-deoxygluconate permease [Eremococcus coleocola]|uniref:2-keto-3-deoxygluconate permease n=1 Tax=Eremococcus coleocola TaxID=88132 RepID=UPI00048A1539|nr:2-keto-3-deoxygluconate permease [Eremococcus coleocola]